MRKPGLAGKGATRKHRIQEKAGPGDPRSNPAERAFTAGGRNRLWAGGIACMPAREGRLYLAAATGAYYADFATPFHVPLLHRSAVG